MRKNAGALLLCLQVACLFGKPTGFALQSGEASPPVQEADGSYLIHSGRQAIVDWDGFSVEVHEHVHFEQLDQDSFILNRVVGPNESLIAGQLSSNGSVYLVNPNGILIGSEAHIETAGFIASTLDLTGEELSEKNFCFAGDSDAKVIHEGKIHCSSGDVFLIGRSVENCGEIVAEEGRAGLLSASEAWICPDQTPRVHVYCAETIDRALLDENAYALAIRHDGFLDAKEVYAMANQGIVQIAGGIVAVDQDVGGEVRILGDEIHLLSPAFIDISGEKGGGTLLCGGDFQGQNPNVYNAQRLFVGPEVAINARARGKGDGGTAIFWSDEATLFYGRAAICGGVEGGDGGFAEVSGSYLDYRGCVDGRSLGKSGFLLLDPVDVTISTGADSNGSINMGTGNWASTGNPAVINTTTLQNQLAMTQVTINTSSGTGTGGTGNITISNPVTWSAANALTLVANGVIAVNASVTNTNNGVSGTTISMTASGTSAGSGVAGISIPTGVTVSTNTGNIVLNGTSLATTGTSHGVSLVGVVSTGSGSISITGTSGASGAGSSGAGNGVHIAGTTSSVVSSTSGAITITGVSYATAANSYGVGYTNNWNPGTSNTLTLSGQALGSAGNSAGISMGGTFTGSGPVVFQNSLGATGGGNGVDIPSSFTTSGDITTSGTISAKNNANFGISIANTCKSTNGNVNFNVTTTNGIAIFVSGTLSTTGGGSITLVGQGTAGNNAQGLFLNSTGSINTTTGSGNISITGTGGSGSTGIALQSATGVRSTAGSIQITGTSGTAANLAGISITYSGTWSTATSNTVTITGICQSSGGSGVNFVSPAVLSTGTGDLVFTNCSCSTGSGSAINLPSGASITATGNVTMSNITTASACTGPAVLVGGSISLSGANKALSITATAGGTSGSCHGISVVGGTLSTTSGNLSLNGTGGAGTSTAHGVNLTSNATVSSTSGTISLTGTAQGSGTCYGVNLAAGSNMVSSTSGPINVTGLAASASGTASHGVIVAVPWVPGTSGLITFSGTGGSTDTSHGLFFSSLFSGGGNVTFSTCTGGSAGGNGVNLTSNFTTNGAVATSSPTSITASAAGSVGFASTANFETTGNNSSISITATSTGTTGNCYGIAFTGGAISTVGTSSPITLTGTGGSSSSISHGIHLSGTLPQVVTANGAISLVGTASGSAASCGVNLASSASPVLSSALSTITVNGTSTASVAGSHGVTIASALSAESSGLMTLTGSGGSTGASYGVNVAQAITQTGTGGVTLSGTATAGGNLIGANITTSGGPILVSTSAVIGATATLDTTNAGGSPGGANITFSSTVNGANALTLTCGTTGTALFNGIVGGTTPLSSLTATGLAVTQNVAVTTTGSISYTSTSPSLITIGGNMTTSGGTIGLNGPVSIASAPTFDTTNGGTSAGGATITFSSTLNGATSATFRAGTAGNVIWTGAVGGSAPPTNLIFTGTTNQLQIGNNVTVTGANLLSLPIAVVLNGSSTMTYSATPLSVTFGSTLDGGNALIIQGGSGTETFTGAVGGITPLASLTVVGGSIVQSSTVQLTGLLSYTGSSSVHGNITTNVGSVTMTGSVTLTGSVTIDTTNTNPAGASILFSGSSSTVNGAQPLTLKGGTGGTVTFGGAIGNSVATGAVLVSSANAVSIGSNITATSFTITPAAPVTLAGSSVITTTAATNGISIPGTIDGTTSTSQALTLAVSGTDTASLLANVGSTVRLGALTISTGNAFSIGASMTTINASSMTVSGSIPTTLHNTSTLTIDTNVASGSISFGGTINGATSGVQALILHAANTISLSGNVGTITALASLTATGTAVTQSAAATTTGPISYTSTSPSLITIGGNMTTSGGTIGLNGPVSIASAPTFDTTNGGTSAAGATITFSSTLNGATSATFRAGTAGNVIWTGAVGGSAPPTNLIFTGTTHQLQIGNNVTVTGANLLSLPIAVLLNGPSTMTYSMTPLSVTFGSTLDGGNALIIQGGSGTETFTGAIGGITPLASLTVVGGSIVQSSTVQLTGLLSYTGSSSLNGNITTNAGSVTMTGPVTLMNNPVTIDTTNTNPAGASILFSGGSSTINGAQPLTLKGGTGGTVTFGGAIGNSVATGAVLVSSASAVSIGSNITATSFTITPAAPVTLAGSSVITTTAATNGISISGTIDGTSSTSQALTLAVSGTDTASLLANVGSTVRLGALTISTG
ncbi:MAG: filamentous hemagglutinin N-terminal domain-containing protein, partial [Verrucomicrobiota bacterium]|nr:filamentous hemagglutinin N-terminal domain-containing protein [Verrucomicrobiota bacterium]